MHVGPYRIHGNIYPTTLPPKNSNYSCRYTYEIPTKTPKKPMKSMEVLSLQHMGCDNNPNKMKELKASRGGPWLVRYLDGTMASCQGWTSRNCRNIGDGHLTLQLRRNPYLLGGFNPFEKYLKPPTNCIGI